MVTQQLPWAASWQKKGPVGRRLLPFKNGSYSNQCCQGEKWWVLPEKRCQILAGKEPECFHLEMLWVTGTADFLAGKHFPWCFPILFCAEPLPHIRRVPTPHVLGEGVLIFRLFYPKTSHISGGFHFPFWSVTIISLNAFQGLSLKKSKPKNPNQQTK